MGLFSAPDFNKNGPGVSKNESKKIGFFLFWDIYIRKFWKLIPLNFILCIGLCSVFFAGPAIAGFVYVLRNFSQERHAFIWSDFIDTAKRNLWQSIAIFFINAILFAILGYAIIWYYYRYEASQSIIHALGLAFCVLAVVLLLFMQYYMYIMLVTFDIGIVTLYKNSLILSVYALPKNILITLIIAATTLFAFTGLSLGNLAITAFNVAFFVMFYFSFTGLAAVFIAYPSIKKTMIAPYTKDEPDITASDEEPVFSDEPVDVSDVSDRPSI